MKRFWGYLLLSVALHVGAGWLLHGLAAQSDPLAWQPPMAIQLVDLEPLPHPAPIPAPAPAARPVPVRQPVSQPKAVVPAKADSIPDTPLPVSKQPAIVKASSTSRPQAPTKPSQPQQPAESRPAQPVSTPAATEQVATQTTPAAKPAIALPPAAITPAAPLTPVVSLRPSFVTPPPAPRYPNQARRRNQQGIVRVEVHLDERGQQLKRVLTRSSGVESLDEAALEAVASWRFRPETVDGRAVPSRVEIPIEFALTANR